MQIKMLFLLLYGLHFRKMSIHLTVKQKVNSTVIQSWECGVARKVLKCTKHLYISMCICVIKERLLKASLSSWCHYNQAYFLRTDASIENTKDQLRVYSQSKCRIFSPVALSAVTLKNVLIIFPMDCIVSLMNSVTSEVYEERKSSITN